MSSFRLFQTEANVKFMLVFNWSTCVEVSGARLTYISSEYVRNTYDLIH